MAEPDLDIHLVGISTGDTAAFGRFVAGAEPSLRRALRPFARALDTEAVLQEALLRVWQVAPRFAPDDRPNALLRFAHRVTRNLAISETRRRRPDLADPASLAEQIDDGYTATPDPLLREVIARCRDELPPKPASALEARLGAAGAQPDSAIAATLRMRTNTFLQNITRARKLLLACLERAGVQLAEVLA